LKKILEYSICENFFLKNFSHRLLKISLSSCSYRNQLENTKHHATVQICSMMLYSKMQWWTHLRIWRISSMITSMMTLRLINQ